MNFVRTPAIRSPGEPYGSKAFYRGPGLDDLDGGQDVRRRKDVAGHTADAADRPALLRRDVSPAHPRGRPVLPSHRAVRRVVPQSRYRPDPPEHDPRRGRGVLRLACVLG